MRLPRRSGLAATAPLVLAGTAGAAGAAPAEVASTHEIDDVTVFVKHG